MQNKGWDLQSIAFEVKFLSNVFSLTQSWVRQSLRNVTAFMHLHDKSLYQFRIVILYIILKEWLSLSLFVLHIYFCIFLTRWLLWTVSPCFCTTSKAQLLIWKYVRNHILKKSFVMYLAQSYNEFTFKSSSALR